MTLSTEQQKALTGVVATAVDPGATTPEPSPELATRIEQHTRVSTIQLVGGGRSNVQSCTLCGCVLIDAMVHFTTQHLDEGAES